MAMKSESTSVPSTPTHLITLTITSLFLFSFCSASADNNVITEYPHSLDHLRVSDLTTSSSSSALLMSNANHHLVEENLRGRRMGRDDGDGNHGMRNYCSYKVVIKTSCSSTRYTRDKISLSFGDAYGNQIYAPWIDDASSDIFESCSTDTFQISGPCAYKICYLYLYRDGRDGWKPSTVKVYDANGCVVTFYYDTFIPKGILYGFNTCSTSHTA